MATPVENPNNQPVIDVKAGLSALRNEFNNTPGVDDTNTDIAKAKMDEVRLKFDEAKTAAAQADKTTLEELSTEIDATDAPLDKFISSGYFYDEALGFKAEVEQLKTVVQEKIAQPRTTMEKIGSMMEKAGETMGKVMERVGTMLSNMGTGAMKGLRMLVEMMGWVSILPYLDGFIKPKEVQDILRSRFPGKKINKADTDKDDVARLEAEWRAKLTADSKTEAAYTFHAFCTDKARDLPDDPAKTEYAIADLITAATPAAAPPDPNKPADPNKPPEGKETPEHKRAKYAYALAEAFNKVASGNVDIGFVTLDREEMVKDLNRDNPTYYQGIIHRMLAEMGPDASGKYPSAALFGITVDSSGTLEEEDGTTWFASYDIDRHFKTNMESGNVKAVINVLKGHTFSSGRSSKIMPDVIKELEDRLHVYNLQ